jgi:glycosyltransferase involved in cell wall biosynthesis
MKLSIIMPVYNEERTLREIIDKIKRVDVEKEIVIVDDGSGDKTRQILDSLQDASIKVIRHTCNKGKGAAIRTALNYISGDVCIIQDGDLEYEPEDYLKLIQPIKNGQADIVYGSRFLAKTKVTTPFHYLVNRFLTFCTNLLFGSGLTDMETCYKLFKTNVIKELDLKSDGFEIEAELTSKAIKKGYKILEVPILYRARSYHDGKKIGWRDGLKTLHAILKFRFQR